MHSCSIYVLVRLLQAQIVHILLDAIKLESAIGLPPILHVLSCLARDLQQDFLPYLPRVLSTFSDLVDAGVHFSYHYL